MRGGGGGPGQSVPKKTLTKFFFFFSPQLILQKSNGQFQRNLSFLRFERGPNIFQGGPTFSRGGGSNCLFPIETHITCDFPGGGGGSCERSRSVVERLTRDRRAAGSSLTRVTALCP